MQKKRLTLVAGLIIVSVVLLCAGGIGLVAVSMLKSRAQASDLIDDLFFDISRRNDTQSYEKHLSVDFRKATSIDQYLKMCNELRSQFGALRYKRLNRLDLQAMNGIQSIDVSYYGDFEIRKATITARLTEAEGSWYVDGIDVRSIGEP